MYSPKGVLNSRLTATEASREPVIPALLIQMDKAIEEQNDCLSRLSSKLECVMQQMHPVPVDPSGICKEEPTPAFVSSLKQKLQKIRSNTEWIADMTNRLEV